MPRLKPDKRASPEPSSAKEHVTKAFASFRPDRRFRQANEARTRVEVIDAVLAALGWPHDDVEPEAPSSTGEYLDYELYSRDLPWMVVEAKRAGVTFELPAAPKKGDSILRGIATLLSQGGPALKDAMKQAATYCNDRGIPLACVTNGFQWLFFRGLSSKQRAWSAGVALTFASADEVIARFPEFFQCLSKQWAGRPFLAEQLDRTPTAAVPAPTVPRDYLTMRRGESDPTRLAVLRSVCGFLLTDIYGEDRREMLERCYVTPGVAGEFEHTLQRLLKDTEAAFDDDAAEVVSGDPSAFATTVAKQAALAKVNHPIVVVGHVGAGKTTFLQRSLAHFRSDHTAFCAMVDLEGFGHGGSFDATIEERRIADMVIGKLSRSARAALKHAGNSDGELVQADPTEPATLRTLLRDRLDEERRIGAKVWDADPAAWDRKEYELFNVLRADPIALLVRFLRHLRGRYRSFPILIVLDNLDQAHEEYQRGMYGYAQRLASETPAVVVVCIREDTFRAGRSPDGFLSSSALPSVFHVACPPLDRLLRQRVQFGEFAADGDLLPRGLGAEKEAVRETCGLLRRTLLEQKSESLNLFAALAGHNMREALGLTRGLVEGVPGVKVEPDATAAFAFECLLVSQGRAGLKTRCKIANIFDAEPSSPPFHALRARLLGYFSWAFDSTAERTFLEETQALVSRFASWGYPAALVRHALFALVQDGLLDSAEWWPQEERDAHALPARLRQTASGYVHLTRLSPLRTYRAAMACETRWYDRSLAESFVSHAQEAGGVEGLRVADIAESSGLAFFDAYLATTIQREDAFLATALERQPWTAEVRARAAALVPASHARTATPAPPPLPSPIGPIVVSEQLSLPDVIPRTEDRTLPTLAPDKSYGGTKWIPRILWSLEWARRNGQGPQSPADMARILHARGEIEVPRNNVARAFRDLRGSEHARVLWRSVSKRYEITEAGTALLNALLE